LGPEWQRPSPKSQTLGDKFARYSLLAGLLSLSRGRNAKSIRVADVATASFSALRRKPQGCDASFLTGSRPDQPQSRLGDQASQAGAEQPSRDLCLLQGGLRQAVSRPFFWVLPFSWSRITLF
jgi:hypothetical protein